MEDDTVERACCVRSYHIYKEIWEAAVGEILVCEREPRNAADRYAVAVKKDGTIIGHLPRKVSRVCSLFLRRGGIIHLQLLEEEGTLVIYLKEALKFPVLWHLKAEPSPKNLLS